MKRLDRFTASKGGMVFVGLSIGVLAALLSKWGNPPNMGICVACFERDIAGALGLHRSAVTQYIRPEIIGFVLGSLVSALLFREFRPRAGSAPIVRFFLGCFAMIGALVFLGCPWRALLRLAGGDANALLGLAGLVSGVWVGSMFLKSGYSLGRSKPSPWISGLVMPAFMLALLLLLVFKAGFAPSGKEGAIFFSAKGPGAMHTAIWISLAVGMVVGILAQRTRFCTMGAFRDVILIRDAHLLTGVLALAAGAFVVNIFTDQFNPGLRLMPIAHSNHLWNFLGMTLAGLAFALAGGCPGRQLFLSGEGDGDAAVFVIGMITGAGIAHNFFFAASPDKLSATQELVIGGPGPYGPYAVLAGLAFCIILGFTMREKTKK